MTTSTVTDLDIIRKSVRSLCAKFPETYWKELDEKKAYPEEFIKTLTQEGWLSVLIPEEYGGAGLGMKEASVILEEVNRSGGNAGAGHAQMYTMGAVLRHGNQEQKQRFLPKIASGELRLQAFGITEPTAGSDTTSITTTAVKKGNRYIVNGQKIWISRTEHSDLMLLLARTTPKEQVAKKTDGLSLFLLDMKDQKDNITIRPIDTMINHHTTEVFFENVEIPEENLIGEEGKGFRYVLSGMNAERILIAAESIGDGLYFIDKSVQYANERVVFDRQIGQNQGVQFPISQSYMEIQAAQLMRDKAAEMFDKGENCGAEANMSKYLATEATWKAANAAMTTYGGYGFATEYNIERKFREARLFIVAPVTNNLVLSYVGQHVLGLPRSF
ncbi:MULTISPECIES: acyl-CoA dehydrogenase family protein [Peribacillus]|uniref:Acyl-CoA dehydrogenase family protein n=1 Tax=Peribacillus frigoritolerans TaxID=450367 RepID=A0AAJ1QM92_9BACI|nr:MULTISPECIES: acyl-CoA dehydrogenase family protein [Peribacillus]MBK5502685.1 acyl-CoA/acyl-ACP dehydrogenase [Peribacillus sp. TH14]MCT4477318.1 acyl-CoA/acyl-ACP dehydrogenase [Peribacillus frigoritolerans]MDM5283998.1 acyl-CoA dehydrogenase family protein [Peribacillus frigoritolerans]MDM5358443.1 acyl-CoA dehydrogenase family protein [Peribacillus sp. ACCC06369]